MEIIRVKYSTSEKSASAVILLVKSTPIERKLNLLQIGMQLKVNICMKEVSDIV